ncbi:MAG TPA: secretin N-terminal domain-containing protein, partial [Fimbriimonadaceae bacterium]|nr:secretin N-terminal domain-containing protein [Fimbriimonadaceae bacterium]
GGGGGNRGGFGGGQPVQSDTAQDDPNAITLNFEDQDDQYGDLLTQVNVRNRLFGAQQNSQGNTTQARGSGGQIVNTRQAQGQVTIIPDPNTNSLIVVGDPENAEMIRNVLAQLDKIPEQVMIETIIVEATLDKSTKMGVEWNLVNGKFLNNSGVTGTGNTDFGLQTNPPAQGFRYTIAGGNIGAFLNALETDDKFRVLSTPRIFTSNNVQAEINISQSVPFIVSQREDANGNFTFNYSFQDVGIVLTVTPRITANGMVTLDVVQTANDLQGFTTFNAPIVNQRQAQTTVSVKDGDTIILGGIMRTQVRATTNKVPLLGDIPILGNLFKSVSRQNEKTELLVFLTPHVVRDPDEARKLKDDELKKLSPDSQKSYQQVRPPVKGGGTGGTTGGTGGTGGGTGGSGGN